MTEAWIACLAAQALLAWRLAPGPVRRYMAWQVASGVVLLAIWSARGPYMWALGISRLPDAALLVVAVADQPIGGRWQLSAALSSLSVGLVVACNGIAPIAAPALLHAIPHFPTAYAIARARGWMLGFLGIRWAMLMAGWLMWSLPREVWIGHQIAQAALFVAWAELSKKS